MNRLFQGYTKDKHVDLEATEFSIRHLMHEIGGTFLEKILNADGGDYCGTRIACGAGHDADFLEYRTKHVTTVVSEIRIKRSYYYCSQCGHGIIPKDRDLDIENTSFSPGVRRMMARVGAKESFDEGRSDLEELAGLKVTSKEVGRVSEGIGEHVEAAFDRERVCVMEHNLIPPNISISILYIAIDGTGVPVVPSETIGRKGKQTEIAKTREAKLGCVFTQTTVDEEGCPIRDEGSTTYIGAIETVEEFGPRIYTEAVRRGIYGAGRVIVLGDGAAWIRGIAHYHFPNAIQIVDLFHSLEYLWEIGKLVYGPTGSAVTQWFQRQKNELKTGEVAKVMTAIKRLKPQKQSIRKEVAETLAYFETNEVRMRYAEWIRQGLFVGSGVIEAGCKTVVAQRLKQSGMRWTVKGANSIIALRCYQISGRWEEFWENRVVN